MAVDVIPVLWFRSLKNGGKFGFILCISTMESGLYVVKMCLYASKPNSLKSLLFNTKNQGWNNL
jgi:hypothetical protein